MSWEQSARCLGMDVDLFIGPDRDESPRRRTAREKRAKAICTQCPVRIPCLVGAIDRDETEGVWGGMTADERERMVYGVMEAADAS